MDSSVSKNENEAARPLHFTICYLYACLTSL